MPTDTEVLFAAAIEAAKELIGHPLIDAAIKARAQRESSARRDEELVVRAAADAAVKADRRNKAYDAYVLSGGEDECFRAGISGACGESCPVMQRGECCID